MGTISLDFGTPVTLSTTAEQDAALQKFISLLVNPALSPGETPYTLETYLRGRLINLAADYISQYQHWAERLLEEAVKAAHPALQQEIEAYIRQKLGL